MAAVVKSSQPGVATLGWVGRARCSKHSDPRRQLGTAVLDDPARLMYPLHPTRCACSSISRLAVVDQIHSFQLTSIPSTRLRPTDFSIAAAAMASLFRDFSFDAPPRLPQYHRTQSPALSVSPTSMSPTFSPARPPTPPPCDVDDLAQAFTKQDLRVIVSPNFRAHCEPLTPPSDEELFEKHIPHQPQLSTARLNSATLRMQRQANVRMQSSLAHIKDISSLVEQMIEIDQCNIHEPLAKSMSLPSPTTTTTTTHDDEGVSMDYTPTAKEHLRSTMPFCRAADRLDGSARVSKKPRMRRSTCTLSKLAKRPSR